MLSALAAGVVIGASALVIPAFPASAALASTAGTGSLGPVMTLPQPGVALRVPRDVRLNGNGFSLRIDGYRFAYQAGTGSWAQKAPPGMVFVVFALSGDVMAANAEVVADGQAYELPSILQRSGTVYYAAPIPAKAREVDLQVGGPGFGQTFSFTKGRRVTPSPAIVYSSPTSWHVVERVGRVSVLKTPDTTNNLDGSVAFTISSLELTYFLPGTGQTPAKASDAWLVLHGSALPQSPSSGANPGSNEDYQQTLPASDFTLHTPGGKAQPAHLAGQGTADDESGASGGYGLLGGDYYWEVPASLRSAMVSVHLPTHLLAQPGFYGDHWGSFTNVPLQGTVPAVTVNFPAPYTPPVPTGPVLPAWAPAPAGYGGA